RRGDLSRGRRRAREHELCHRRRRRVSGGPDSHEGLRAATRALWRQGRGAVRRVQSLVRRTVARQGARHHGGVDQRLRRAGAFCARAPPAMRTSPVKGATMICSEALQLILAAEGMNQPGAWPGGSSGITLGIGYDLGYVTVDQFESDWGACLNKNARERLRAVVGL